MRKRVVCMVVAGSLASALSALSQNNGPDVIVGDLIGEGSPSRLSNWTGSSPVNVTGMGLMRAYSVGTVSCNIGNQPLTWQDDGSNQYPVISGNLYRLRNDRFEQIGQSWLKHAFCALQGTVCSPCTPGGNCDALFPGCSDPYSSGLNGSQGGLGPKREINASTGFFPINWNGSATNFPGDTAGVLTKRLVVADADLDASTGLYFVSSMYVQPEDALAGNDNNNQSYRRVTVGTDASKNLFLTGSTQREKPAIHAWRDNDPQVVLTNVDVSGDGRFIVGVKVINIGGGLYRYEYAIQNLNSDRSGQAFTIPLPAGTQVQAGSNYFKDVLYHSGEPYSGTDWSFVNSGSSVSWSTQTHAQNVNANALRWDTIYNYSFVCNKGPSAGSATLALFKPGTPTSVSCPRSSRPTQGPSARSTTAARWRSTSPAASRSSTATAPRPTGPMSPAPAPSPTTPTSATTSGSAGPTATAPARPPSPPAALPSTPRSPSTPAAPAAAASGSPATTTPTATTAAPSSAPPSPSPRPPTPPTTSVSAATTAPPARGNLNIAGPNCGPTPPSNDRCADATWLTDGVPVTGTTLLAGGPAEDGQALGAGTHCGGSATSADVWYLYRPQVSGFVTFHTCGPETNYDTVIEVFNAPCGASLLQCNDDFPTGQTVCTESLRSYIRRSLTANTTYLIRVAGYNGSIGNFRLSVIGGGGIAPPLNDNCSEREGLGMGTLAFSTVGATTDGPPTRSATSSGATRSPTTSGSTTRLRATVC